MNSILKYVAYVVAAFVLFVGSFLSFAAFSGTPMRELTVVGSLFPAAQPDPATGVDASTPLGQLESDPRTPTEVIEDASLPLQAFVLQSPFTTSELQELQRELKSLVRANELRAAELDRREDELDARSEHVAERWLEIESLRTNLMDSELEMEQRKDELERDVASQAEREKESWARLGAMFAEGDVEDLMPKLTAYPPDKAAKILRSLPPERARMLLNEIPVGPHLEYSDAYRLSED